MTTEEAAQLVSLAWAAFPTMQEREMGPVAELWHMMLGHLPFAVAKAALASALTTARFFPTPADILDAAASIRNPGRLTSGDAWAAVCREIRRVGWCGQPRWDSPLIGRAVEAMGGWRQLCASEEPEVDRAHFLKIYSSMDERARTEDKLPPKVRQITADLANRLGLSGREDGG